MNEENNVVKPEKKKKKRSFWWLWLLLILVVFAGGVVVGLKLNTMPMPYEIVNRYFPALAPSLAPAAAEESPALVADTPEPTATPVPTEAPRPVETETPEPAETEAPVEPEESAAPDPVLREEEKDEAVLPSSSDPEAVEEPEESMKPVFGKKDEAEEAAGREPVEAAAAQSIGIDKALKAALDHAGVRKADAEITGVYKTLDVDTTVYAVEFRAHGTEYEYRINALTAEVEGWRSSRAAGEVADSYYYPDTPDIEKELFPAINRAKKSR